VHTSSHQSIFVFTAINTSWFAASNLKDSTFLLHDSKHSAATWRASYMTRHPAIAGEQLFRMLRNGQPSVNDQHVTFNNVVFVSLQVTGASTCYYIW